MSTKYQPDLGDPFGQRPDSLANATLVYQGFRFDVLQDGKKAAVIHPGAAVILPLLDDEHIIMIKNQRFVVNETLWELPAGTLEKHEHPQVTAERELIEETGYKCAKIEYLTQFYTTPGFCNELMFAYKATGLECVGQNLDENEKIEVIKVSVAEALQMVHEGKIKDGKTMTTLLYYMFYKENHVK